MQHSEYKAFLDHIYFCNDAFLNQHYLPLRAFNALIGWVSIEKINILQRYGAKLNTDSIVSLSQHLSLEDFGNRLIQDRYVLGMNEAFDVYPTPYDKPIGIIDRSILPFLGFIGSGVHLNGLVKKPSGIFLWVGKRSASKRLDPNKLDHMVAGGIPAGHDHKSALLKEASEEANIPNELVNEAHFQTMISYSTNRPEGLRRDVIYCYDLWLPDHFRPVPNDGEVSEFILLPIEEVYQQVLTTRNFKFNVNLVLIDLFLRIGLIPSRSEEGQNLKHGLCGKLFP